MRNRISFKFSEKCSENKLIFKYTVKINKYFIINNINLKKNYIVKVCLMDRVCVTGNDIKRWWILSNKNIVENLFLN